MVVYNAEVCDSAMPISYFSALVSHLLKSLAVRAPRLAAFTSKYRALPTLGLTHFESAQLTMIGERATLDASASLLSEE